MNKLPKDRIGYFEDGKLVSEPASKVLVKRWFEYLKSNFIMTNSGSLPYGVHRPDSSDLSEFYEREMLKFRFSTNYKIFKEVGLWQADNFKHEEILFKYFPEDVLDWVIKWCKNEIHFFAPRSVEFDWRLAPMAKEINLNKILNYYHFSEFPNNLIFSDNKKRVTLLSNYYVLLFNSKEKPKLTLSKFNVVDGELDELIVANYDEKLNIYSNEEEKERQKES